MEMQMPRISIIIPVYNVENYIRTCIESILIQTYPYFELILIDDGSSDLSPKIIDEYGAKDPRLKVIHQKNKGVSIARNVGIEQAQSPWICFIDSDDWVEPNYIENFITAVKQKENNTCIYQGILFDYDNKIPNEPFFQYDNISFNISSKGKIAQYKLLHNGCPYGKLYNKNLLMKYNIRFQPNISIHEDHIFVWSYLQYVENITLVSGLTYHYMKRDRETLCTRNHSAEEWLTISQNLLDKLATLQTKCDLINTAYLQQIYTDFGIQQLIKAINNISSENYKKILSEAKLILKKIQPIYKPDTIKKKFVFYLIKNGFPYKILFFIITHIQH